MVTSSLHAHTQSVAVRNSFCTRKLGWQHTTQALYFTLTQLKMTRELGSAQGLRSCDNCQIRVCACRLGDGLRVISPCFLMGLLVFTRLHSFTRLVTPSEFTHLLVGVISRKKDTGRIPLWNRQFHECSCFLISIPCLKGPIKMLSSFFLSCLK